MFTGRAGAGTEQNVFAVDTHWRYKHYELRRYAYMSDIVMQVSMNMWDSVMILALLGQKLWDKTSSGLKTGRSKTRYTRHFSTQKQICWLVLIHDQKPET